MTNTQNMEEKFRKRKYRIKRRGQKQIYDFIIILFILIINDKLVNSNKFIAIIYFTNVILCPNPAIWTTLLEQICLKLQVLTGLKQFKPNFSLY